ncbi:MAG: single-stranded-DNA-specific exonuclease RecJ [Bacteroidetes bacterium]|nr:single-stranded-DNA-specific exonuclease RecJ [Bacteroidota bacterium]
MEKNWKLKNLFPEDGGDGYVRFDTFINDVRGLKGRIKIPDSVAKLLYMRGVTDYDKVIRFFKPTLDKLHDPMLMKGCDLATRRVLEAIQNKEKVMILGDYDVDGIIGASMFSLFLKHYGADVSIFIPNRISQEYGLSKNAIDEAKEDYIKLLVAIDCGITAISTVDYSNEKGIDVIVCDHHQPPEVLPNAYAIMDPIQPGCEYPFKHLCGTGVAFKLIQSVCRKLGGEEFAFTLLDFVAIATSSDIVPITDENRILVNEGFAKINSNPRPSIKALIEKIGLKENKVNTTNIVFSLAPRINAVGRLGEADRAVDMLISDNVKELDDLVNILDEENANRREIDKNITEKAYHLYEEQYKNGDDFCIVLHNEDWHPGVISIVAARMVEKYNRPTIVLTTIKGTAKGSARSINGFNVYDALKNCEDLLVQYGGHAHAAGLEIEVDKIDEFRKRFNDIAKKELISDDFKREIDVDLEINFEDINPTFIKIISFFEPFGPGNPQPVFMTKNVKIIDDVKFTKVESHVFKVSDGISDRTWNAVFYNSKEHLDNISKDTICDICYTIDKNNRNGYTKLIIKDIRIH